MSLATDLVSFVSRCTVDGLDQVDQPLPRPFGTPVHIQTITPSIKSRLDSSSVKNSKA
jgi:hypothetical protein